MSDFKFTPVPKEVLDKAVERALFAAQEQIKTDCNYYCRQDQGTLIDSSATQVRGDTLEISWNTPYARRVYFTGTPSKQVNPHASLMWAEVAEKRFRKDWTAILEKGVSANL